MTKRTNYLTEVAAEDPLNTNGQIMLPFVKMKALGDLGVISQESKKFKSQ